MSVAVTTRSWTARAFAVACLSCSLALSACAAAEDAATGKVEVGAPAPAYVSTALNGDSVSLQQLRGKVVLLNVWATWCHPCRTEIPELRALHAKYQASGLELIGVSVDADGNDDALKSFMDEFKMTYPVWRDPDERVSAQFLVMGVPATFLIDREGILRWRMTGAVPAGDTTLANAIERALAD